MSRMSVTTVTVSVNIATANLNEGNSGLVLNVDSSLLEYLNITYLQNQFRPLLEKALLDYRINNDLNENYEQNPTGGQKSSK